MLDEDSPPALARDLFPYLPVDEERDGAMRNNHDYGVPMPLLNSSEGNQARSLSQRQSGGSVSNLSRGDEASFQALATPPTLETPAAEGERALSFFICFCLGFICGFPAIIFFRQCNESHNLYGIIIGIIANLALAVVNQTRELTAEAEIKAVEARLQNEVLDRDGNVIALRGSK